ncbi:MAG: peptidoglycan DD-metalloendopeptidase family protein [Bauldia sp.]|nr:peptidoglycan DD-metalloendopeptidase family protein [Bauldia sp.]
MRIKEISFRPRVLAQVVTVVILASASAACSNASRFGLPMFTGSTNASAQPGGAQPLPPATLGGASATGAPLTPNPGARVTAGAGASTVARADLPPLSPAISTAPQPAASPGPVAAAPLPSYTDPRLATPAPVAASGYPSGPAPAPRPGAAPTSIAQPAPVPVAVASAGPQTVTVAPGQTLYSISRTYGVSVDAIMRENGISNASRVQAGAQLRIPGTSAVANTQVAAANPTVGSLGTVPATRTDAPSIAATPAPQPVPQPTVAVNVPPAAPTIAQTPPAAPTTPVAAPPTAPPSASGTEFRWPVNGRIISSFGIKPDGERNDGINLAVPEGTSIKATEAGTVIYAGNEIAGYGNLILVRHAGGWVSAYAHAKEIMVERGQSVVRGQTIAVVGASGSVTQPQLHFELRQGSTPVNPLDHLSGA